MTQGTFLFLGDSLVADFNWQERMHHFKILNYGLPGETAQGLLDRIPSITEAVEPPEIIMLMIGTNNLIIEDYSYLETLQKIIVQLTSQYPTTDIITNSLFPFQIPWIPHQALEDINSQVEILTMKTGCCYLDMFSKIKPTPEFFQRDGVHLTPKSYDLWAKSILEFVSFLVEDD